MTEKEMQKKQNQKTGNDLITIDEGESFKWVVENGGGVSTTNRLRKDGRLTLKDLLER